MLPDKHFTSKAIISGVNKIQHTNPQQKILRSLPESIPRQKTCMYICLILFTSLLIYFYSYPLDLENWDYIRHGNFANIIKSIKNASPSNTYDLSYEDYSKPDSIILQKLLPNRSRTTDTTQLLEKTSLPAVKSTVYTTDSIEVSPSVLEEVAKESNTNDAESEITTAAVEELQLTNEEENDSARIVHENEITETTGKKDSTTYDAITKETMRNTIFPMVANNELNLSKTHSTTPHTEQFESTIQYKDSTDLIREHETGTTRMTSTYLENEVQTGSATQGPELKYSTTGSEMKSTDLLPLTKNATSGVSGVEKGFLVFSENCRIPDLDPMHPSIRHLVEKTPPLNCLKDHEPLTRTEGNILFLDKATTLERTKGGNYTCCYRSVERQNDDESDDDIKFGEECIEIIDKRDIIDEFITVECKYQNGTAFYKEFHSFIHDKPEVEKRCDKPVTSQYSVLIIGVDAMSRMNMHRQLNATAQYLLKEMDAVEMYGFNKVGDNTFPNLIPLLVGYDERELPSTCWTESEHLPIDKCNFIWKRFAEKGYRTFYAEDTPHISSFNYMKKGFYHQPTDYYFRHFILAYENALGRDKPLNCYLCVGSVSETEAILHWTKQFALHFSDRPYFAFSWINSLTHDYLNMGSSGDHMHESFLHSLHQTGALDNTIVILMGDHGMRWGEIRNTYIGRLEERLPMLMIALPRKFKQDQPKFTEVLQQNSHRLVTPFDLHATLVHLLNLGNNWSFTNPDNVDNELSKNFTSRAQSLFHPVPQDRSCDDAFIEEHWCTCETSLEADIKSDSVKQVAKYLVDHVNNLLKPMSHKCAVLDLDLISDARIWQPPSEHKGHSAEDNIYTVVIHAKPGGAVFEGTVKVSGSTTEQRELLGTISRLNLYGNQSSCMDNAILKKYCYCL